MDTNKFEKVEMVIEPSKMESIKKFFAENGKKIAIVAACVAGGAIALILARTTDLDDPIDVDLVEDEFSEEEPLLEEAEKEL